MGTKTGPRCIMLLLLVFCLSGASASGAENTTDEKELQRIKQEMREKKKELKRVDRKERSILADLETIDRDIQAGSAELVEQQQRLRASEAALREIERNNALINAELVALKLRYSLRIRAVYKMKLSIRSDVPTGTRVEYLLRKGRDPGPESGEWSEYRPIGSGPTAEIALDRNGLNRRYIQFKAVLSTADPLVTPVVRSAEVNCEILQTVPTPGNSAEPIAAPRAAPPAPPPADPMF